MFTKRIEKRKNLWWSSPRHPQSLLQRCQKLAMLHRSMSTDASEQSWRRGTHWQRRLLNKLNSKQFADRLYVPTPELYWRGRYLNQSVLNALPEQFVIKPAVGRACQGVHVISGDRDLLSNRSMTRDDLLEEIASHRGRFSYIPLLAEELVRDENQEDSLPIDYKFYMFADSVGAIEVIHRSASHSIPTTQRFYNTDWTPCSDRMQTKHPMADVVDEPSCLKDMITVARRISLAFDTFVRVDLYASQRGCLFGELSSIPHGGRGFTEEADILFDSLWRANCPDAI